MIEFIGLILFFFANNNNLKSLLLTSTLILVIYKLEKNKKKEKFITINSLKNINILKNTLKKCCNIEEYKIFKKALMCLLNDEKSYNILANDINTIVPSEKSIFEKLMQSFK